MSSPSLEVTFQPITSAALEPAHERRGQRFGAFWPLATVALVVVVDVPPSTQYV